MVLLLGLGRRSGGLREVQIEPPHCSVEPADGDVGALAQCCQLLAVPEDTMRDGAVLGNSSCLFVRIRTRNEGVDIDHAPDVRFNYRVVNGFLTAVGSSRGAVIFPL